VVDLRKGSQTFGQWESFEVNEDTFHQVYCPVGFAHGFRVLSDVADVMVVSLWTTPARSPRRFV
jgi:dTDP-4-dehydrorhamnose 3,5-epimerase